ncbi:hypothetical protein [Paraburkholderia sp. J63]|uniref:hypothetical protein n=1 Tax=Paraburkholderia sp. J63 TaxID=2805434 RepID=UPI002ABD61D9|nr:hypothetical protein [Paraburkholderia sp. J63]
MKSQIFPVSMLWVEWKDGRLIPVIRDAHLDVLEPFLDYILRVARDRYDANVKEGAFRSTMQNVGYALLALARYLASERLIWQELTDDSLVGFRDWVKDEARRKASSRNEESAKRTANARLRVIYEFVTWAQEDALLIQSVVGNSAASPIRSSLPRLRNVGHKNLRGDKQRYPKLFQDVGASSRTSDRQYWATDEDFEEIRQQFWSTHGPDTATRNDLFLRLFEGLGWRRASVNSLTIDQFSDSIIDEAVSSGETHISIVPPEQKSGYQRAFPVPINLALTVQRYIKEERGELLQKHGLRDGNSEIHQRRLFLSMNTALPLTHSAVSEIFRAAFRAIGGEIGANTHSFRRKFAEATWAEEIEFRQREGLSLAYEDVAMAVADALGHASIISQDAYHRVLSRLRKLSVEQTLRNKVAALNDKIALQMSTIVKLRDTLAKCLEATGCSAVVSDSLVHQNIRNLIAELDDA